MTSEVTFTFWAGMRSKLSSRKNLSANESFFGEFNPKTFFFLKF